MLQLSIFVAIIICSVYPFLFSGAANASEAQQNEEVSGVRIKIRRLQQGISRQQSKIQKTTAEERNVLEDLEILDKTLLKHTHTLKELQQKMIGQKLLIDKESKALEVVKKEKEIVQKHLQKRITAYYTMGEIGLLNVTFSTKSMTELLSFHDAFNALIKYDRNVIHVYQETIKDLNRRRDTLSLEEEILSQFIEQTEEEKENVEKAKDEKNSLLTRIRTQAQLHQKAIEEMRLASNRLAESIIDIKTKKQSNEKGFLAKKGSLPPPLNGFLITRFDEVKENRLGISRKSKGIELKAEDGTEIISISEGQITYAGYLRGYGNTVVINHGMQYYTVTSRIEKILVSKGQKVKREEKIGIMGDAATVFENGLYFEIRHGRLSLDPLQWLNPNRLTISRVQ